MPKKVKDDSDSDKKPKKKTKAKKKTTKKKDKGITINLNVGSTGGNNKKTGRGGKGGFGGGVKNNRGFFSYASKDKNTNKYNTTEPANIRPLAHNSSMVSGHLDKNDAKDIEKLQNKLTIQDNNIIQGVEHLKTLQNQLIKLENTPNKEVVYIQSPYNNNVPESAIKEVRRGPGRPRKNVIIEEVKEKKKPGPKPKVKTIIIKEDKVKKKPGPKPKVQENLSTKFDDAGDKNFEDIPAVIPNNMKIINKMKTRAQSKKETIPPEQIKVYGTEAPIPQFSFNENPEPFLKPNDNNENNITEVVGKTSKPKISKGKTTKLFTHDNIKKLLDKNKLDELIKEYNLNKEEIETLLGPRSKTKLQNYLYEVLNNPEVKNPGEEIDIFPNADNPFDEGLNMSVKKKRKSKKNESLDVYTAENPLLDDLNQATADLDKLLDQTILNTSGLNILSGGSLDESLYDEDPDLLSNIMFGGAQQV
jgi:hypothetical protein